MFPKGRLAAFFQVMCVGMVPVGKLRVIAKGKSMAIMIEE